MEKGKHFLPNEAIVSLIESGQVIHVFLPPQLNLFLPQFLSFISNVWGNCTCEASWGSLIDSGVNLTGWNRRVLERLNSEEEETDQDSFFCSSSRTFNILRFYKVQAVKWCTVVFK